ncbi:MAG: ORF6N domain-containing protein [Candidatus Omnitrophica bacterium]|nr:ORF6N domain-containing protein [Candidatus Omnitrophota bacterium]
MERFPEGFMFQLTREEHQSLRFQFGTLEVGVPFPGVPGLREKKGTLHRGTVHQAPKRPKTTC